MKRSNLLIAVYLLLIFLSGAVVGGFAYRLYVGTPASAKTHRASPEEWRRQYMNEMQARLHLTPVQVTEINRILDDTRERFHAARQRNDAEIKQIREHHVDRILAVLKPEQRPEYEKLHAEREQRSHAENKNR